jgi:hypothetical protein
VSVQGWSGAGVLIQANGSAKIVNASLTGDAVGADINGPGGAAATRAFLQGDNLTGDSIAGIRAQGGAWVDAGQVGGGYDFTNLNGGGVGQGSTGGNLLSGYTPYDGSTSSPVAALLQGGFETPNVGSGTFNSFQYNPTGSAWTFSGTSGISGNGSGFTVSNPNAPEGVQVAFLQSLGSFSQTVTLAAGKYNLTFQAAQRGNFQSSSQTFQVLIDGTPVGSFKPAGTAYSTITTAGVTLTAGQHTIVFQGTNPNGGDNTAFVDQVQLNLITPPPASGSPVPTVSQAIVDLNPASRST